MEKILVIACTLAIAGVIIIFLLRYYRLKQALKRSLTIIESIADLLQYVKKGSSTDFKANTDRKSASLSMEKAGAFWHVIFDSLWNIHDQETATLELELDKIRMELSRLKEDQDKLLSERARSINNRSDEIYIKPRTESHHFGGYGSKYILASSYENDDNVKKFPSIMFKSLRPKHVVHETWNTMVVYLYKDKASKDVEADISERRLKFRTEIEEGTARSTSPVAPGTDITIIPVIDGFSINPPQHRIAFYEDWHSVDFRVKSNSMAKLHTWNRGRISFFIGPLLIADIETAMIVEDDIRNIPEKAMDELRPQNPTFYRKIFASYAHKDQSVIEKLETAYQLIGDEYMRDIKILRSGEEWNSRIFEEIERADIFQLFWSGAAKNSVHVEAEWKHALSLNRKYFIRPSFWEVPMPQPPAELASIHFSRLSL